MWLTKKTFMWLTIWLYGVKSIFLYLFYFMGIIGQKTYKEYRKNYDILCF